MATASEANLGGMNEFRDRVTRGPFPKSHLKPLRPDGDFCYIECQKCHVWFPSDDFSTIRMRCDDCTDKYGMYEQRSILYPDDPNCHLGLKNPQSVGDSNNNPQKDAINMIKEDEQKKSIGKWDSSNDLRLNNNLNNEDTEVAIAEIEENSEDSNKKALKNHDDLYMDSQLSEQDVIDSSCSDNAHVNDNVSARERTLALILEGASGGETFENDASNTRKLRLDNQPGSNSTVNTQKEGEGDTSTASTDGHSNTASRDDSVKPADKPFHCVLCSKNFTLPYGLTEHMRTHTGEKPYACEVCRRAFSKKNNLKRHMLIHTGRRDHKCHLCDRAFSLLQSLKSHFKMHPSFPGLPFECELCGDDFMTRKDMNIHKSIRHSKTCQRIMPARHEIVHRRRPRRKPLDGHASAVHRLPAGPETTAKPSPDLPHRAELTACVAAKVPTSPTSAKAPYSILVAASPESMTSSRPAVSPEHTSLSRPSHATMLAVRSVLRTADRQKSHGRSPWARDKKTSDIPIPDCMDMAQYTTSATRPSPSRNKRKSVPKKIERLPESLQMTTDAAQVYVELESEHQMSQSTGNTGQPISVKEGPFERSHEEIQWMPGGNKRFECEECGKVMTTSSNLRIHKIIHTGEKPYKCGNCEAAYANPSSLNRHKRSLGHFLGEVQYPCEQCGKAFTSEVSLRRHERNSTRHRISFVTPEATGNLWQNKADLHEFSSRRSCDSFPQQNVELS